MFETKKAQLMTLTKFYYNSPLGKISLVASDQALVGAWFVGQAYFQAGLTSLPQKGTNFILQEAASWLDTYFEGNPTAISINLAPKGTLFQQNVWEALCHIPYGETITYGQLATQVACQSAQAVGAAIGRNPLSLFIPCHRVIAADGQLRGYAGGLDKKAWLLKHETSLVTKEKK